ncbi:MAG: hypothetical protein P8K81_01970 [Flavobacteriales bacterium]|nr:hypothetical protein [Flavobacteriales bacterium]
MPSTSFDLMLSILAISGVLFCTTPDSILSPIEDPSARSDMRKAFRAVSSEDQPLEAFFLAIESFTVNYPNDQAIIGFQATAELMEVESIINPLTKFEGFIKWRDVLEQSIKNHPQDHDLRFFRLTVQLHVPRMLGYRGSIPDDTQLVANALKSGVWENDSEHATFVRAFLLSFDLTYTESP